MPSLWAARKSLMWRSTALDRVSGPPFGAVAAAYGNIGLVKAKRHDLKNARQYLLKALGIYQRLNRQKMVVKVQSMLTQISKAAA